MAQKHKTETGHGTAVAEHAQNCNPAPKWAALIGDRLFPMPRQKLTARDILDQAGVGRDSVLVRDHGSLNDVVLSDETLVDLAEGNVLRVIPRCEAGPQQHCTAPPKLAFVNDDAWEVTLIAKQTGHSLKRLLGLPDDSELFRDFESPDDQPIGDNETVLFTDGPVFTSRGKPAPKEVKIIVNGREKVVTGKSLSYAALVVLAFGAVDPDTIYTVTFKHGPPSKPEGSMVEGDVVKIQCGMIFNVTPTRKS
jgi:hypothetical protein